MNYLGISYDYKNKPLLDESFIPFGVWARAYLEGANRPFKVALEREKGRVSVFHSRLRGEEYAEANLRYMERYVKFLLWSVGGWKVTICGCAETAEKLKEHYREGGLRDFDVHFEYDIFERPFELVICEEQDFPRANEHAKSIGGHLEGCRIGFDAGGSDRKVSAVIDGVSVYSEEVVWFPKQSADPTYQYNGIVEAFKAAGISGVQQFLVGGPMQTGVSDSTNAIGTDSWRQLMRHAILECQRLGLSFGTHNCPGWSSSAFPTVTPEYSMQRLTWSDTIVSIEAGMKPITL